MPSLKPKSKSFSLPTKANHNLAIFLLFLSAVSYFIAPYLAQSFGYSAGKAALISTPAGAVLMLSGLVLLLFARKIIRIEQGSIQIKDGFLASPLTFSFKEIPVIKLSSYEDVNGKRSVSVWTVHLITKDQQYLIDRRIENQIWSRALSEHLAKSTGANLIEVLDGVPQEFNCSELDSSFIERIQKYPSLLGAAVAQPASKPTGYQQDEQGIKLSLSLFHSGLIVEIFMLGLLLTSIGFIPIPGGRDQASVSLYQIAGASGDYRYFQSVAAFTLISLVLLAGYKASIELSEKSGASAQIRIWGLPLRRTAIALDKLEQIGSAITSRGPYILLVSDEKIIKEMVSSSEYARWIAWEMKNFLKRKYASP